MTIDYRLTLATEAPPESVAARAFPDPSERPRPTTQPNVLSEEYWDRCAFDVTVRSGRDGYVEAEDGAGQACTWEPRAYVNLTFRLDKFDLDRALESLLPVVQRVLATGTEDAAFVHLSDYLLLTRFDGVVTKHRRAQWWDHYGWVDELLPG
ncbi:hypothetical protein Val02_23910 [Virgisporangium aliadipatigenens]|uniref:Uncharacterized protein n=1 Tax=Virgisporangium aliadipatigenens TaxID=741659 RepID=A0A8J4DP25_9ACTN|nr:SitI3 family protein [Virgisporangium aliadipatigenens]GIJ45505.1 hypothetical protein Val02_23910 [Virgisporangium aliadipatigenens]